jgi:hypothetical protein
VGKGRKGQQTSTQKIVSGEQHDIKTSLIGLLSISILSKALLEDWKRKKL